MKTRSVPQQNETHEELAKIGVSKAPAQLRLKILERRIFLQRVQRVTRQVNYASVIIVCMFTDRANKDCTMQLYLQQLQPLIT
ncbi:hypothetical protein D3C84_983880 [compost metagenome]